MGIVGGGGNPAFTAGMLAFAVAAMVLLPMFLGIYAPTVSDGVDENELLDGYERMTGQKASTKVSVWPLTGVYTPFTGSFFDPDANGGAGQTITAGWTEDGWLFGTEIKSYSPSQYQGTPQQYTVAKSDDGVFRYAADSKDYNETYGTGHKQGELYTEVSFDKNKKSDIFFTEATRQTDGQGHFKYDYTGYRMAFQPIAGYNTMDQDGKVVPVVATTTSLSLIWYQVAGGAQSGISGNLVLSGSSSGVAYINAARVLEAFDATTSVASFDMVFNGVKMTVLIKIDPVYTSQGWTVQQCYNEGFWSIMVTSLSVDSSAYLGTDNATNPMELLQTVIDLFTFNLSDYNMSPWLQTLCSIVFIAPMYVTLIALCLEYSYLWIAVGVLAAIQALGSWWPF